MPSSNIKEEREDRKKEDSILSGIVGENLKRLRKNAKTQNGQALTIELLSRLTVLSHSAIWRFESGDCGMTVATLVRVREALGCSWDDLLKGCESNIVKERKRFTGELRKR